MNQEELKEVFLSEALEKHEELDKFLIVLEKNPHDIQAIAEIFRITHTLKANAAAMDYEGISQIAHLLEDIFGLFKETHQALPPDLFKDIFRASDTLKALIISVKSRQKIHFKGLLARLKVILRNFKETPENPNPTPSKEIVESELSHENSTHLPDKVPDPSIPEEIEARDQIGEKEHRTNSEIAFSESITIPVKKLDTLLNLVEELSIERDRVATLSEVKALNFDTELSRLQRITSELQYSVMHARLVQINMLFQKFHRIVRDVAAYEHKSVRLLLKGNEIEIDRNILQIISDSLIHIVRNGISHGIESQEERQKAGKPTTGTITLEAKNEKNSVCLRVSDDGKGIDIQRIKQKIIEKKLLSPETLATLPDKEIINYIFEAGFSSAETVSEISGRGVGMNVVREVIHAVGGKIFIETQPGKGTSFQLELPASMAVKPILFFISQDEQMGIAIHYVEAVISKAYQDIYRAANTYLTVYQDKNIPIIPLDHLLGWSTQKFDPRQKKNSAENPYAIVIIISDGTHYLGLMVDQVLQHKDIIEKKLKAPVDRHPFLSGATILGNGKVSLILDAPSIIHYVLKTSTKIKSYEY
ncbi:MAG: chemotaxis protein CheA [Microscillaceae bacterium]|nr:chemotaxis protein CheA [Microscillaceae bacterium]